MSSAAALLTVLGVAQRFDPRTSLFGHFEPGFDYDFSDTTTLFQDSAGTTPVTGVEQTVALILDKSRGLVLGPELVTNGNFAVDANWSKGAGWTISSGAANYNGSGNNAFTQAGVFQSGRTYVITFDLTVTSGGVNLWINGTQLVESAISTSGTKTYRFTTTTAGSLYFESIVAAAVLSIDNISVRELPGLHQQQSTAASRAVLRSRYNLLTYSEQFDNAVWNRVGAGTGSAPTVTPNDATAPDGTLTADLIVFNRGAGNALGDQSYISQAPTLFSATYTQTVWIKAATGGDVGKQLALRNAAGVGYGVVTLTANWARYSRVETGSSGNWEIANRGTITADNSVSAHVWGADLRPANDTIYPYQRINAATDYATGPQWPTYLEYDGVDDSYASAANLDLSGTDKVTVFAAVTKLSDAGTTGTIAELGTDIATVNGSFSLWAPHNGAGANDVSFNARGTSTVYGAYTNAIVAAPLTAVLTGAANIAGPQTLLRVNGVQRANDIVAPLGTGNFGSYPLFLGRRNNTNLPFRGRMYRVIGRGAATPVATISQCERFLARQTGITL